MALNSELVLVDDPEEQEALVMKLDQELEWGYYVEHFSEIRYC